MYKGQAHLFGKMPLPDTVDLGVSSSVREAVEQQRTFVQWGQRFKPQRLCDLHRFHIPDNKDQLIKLAWQPAASLLSATSSCRSDECFVLYSAILQGRMLVQFALVQIKGIGGHFTFKQQNRDTVVSQDEVVVIRPFKAFECRSDTKQD